MNAVPAPRPPIARLYQPRLEVSPFVRAFVVRDTRGSRLAGDGLLNRYPASMHCTLVWMLEGEGELVSSGGSQAGIRSVPISVSGCQTQPVTTRNLGDVHMFMVLFYPDAFHALFGVDLAPLQNRFDDARAVLPAHGIAMAEAVLAARSDAERQDVVERFVLEHAAKRPLSAWLRIRRMSQNITLGMASRMLGIGPRQLQRLAPREVGASLQTLIRLRRGERSFLNAQRRFAQTATLNLADHALENDYADQSHLARECKAQTGRTPLQLLRDVQREEADWVYRLEFSHDEDPQPPHPA
jgi:AraC-like DNA-binding protein